MKRRNVVLVVLGVVLTVMLALAINSAAQDGAGNSPGPEDESNAPVEPVIPERYRPTGDAPSATSEIVYFTPQDNTANVTVISLYSTSGNDENVSLETFRLDGSTLVTETVMVPAGEMVRIVSDELVDPAPGDWGQAIYIQFFNTSAFARLALPEGIKADAYIAWTGTLDYDPTQALATFGLRFSKDPASVYLPTTMKE
jgi:hypothetical protein